MATQELFVVTSRVPKRVYAALRAQALMNETSMNDIVLKLLEETVEPTQKRINEDIKKIQQIASFFGEAPGPPEAKTNGKRIKNDHRRRITGRRNMPRITDEIRANIIEAYLAHPKWTAKRIGRACGGYSETSVYKSIKQYVDILNKRGVSLHSLSELPEAYKSYSALVKAQKLREQAN